MSALPWAEVKVAILPCVCGLPPLHHNHWREDHCAPAGRPLRHHDYEPCPRGNK